MDYVTLVLNILAVVLCRNLISGFVYFLLVFFCVRRGALSRSKLVLLFDLIALCCEEALCVSFLYCSHALLY